jgi:hypothetical protein
MLVRRGSSRCGLRIALLLTVTSEAVFGPRGLSWCIAACWKPASGEGLGIASHSFRPQRVHGFRCRDGQELTAGIGSSFAELVHYINTAGSYSDDDLDRGLLSIGISDRSSSRGISALRWDKTRRLRVASHRAASEQAGVGLTLFLIRVALTNFVRAKRCLATHLVLSRFLHQTDIAIHLSLI